MDLQEDICRSAETQTHDRSLTVAEGGENGYQEERLTAGW